VGITVAAIIFVVGASVAGWLAGEAVDAIRAHGRTAELKAK
jgi:hypothetical protein